MRLILLPLAAACCGLLSSCVSNGPVGNPAYGDQVERVERSGGDVGGVPYTGEDAYVPAAANYGTGHRGYSPGYGYGRYRGGFGGGFGGFPY